MENSTENSIMESFTKLFTESLDSTDIDMEIYKEIKKKYKKKAVRYEDDFKETDTFDMKLSDGSKIKVYYNDKDFSKPIFDFEWL